MDVSSQPHFLDTFEHIFKARKRVLSRQMAGSLSSRGFSIVALSPDQQALVARAWREYDDFATYTLLERNRVRLLSFPEKVLTFDSLCETSLLHSLALGGERTVRNAEGRAVKLSGTKLAAHYTGLWRGAWQDFLMVVIFDLRRGLRHQVALQAPRTSTTAWLSSWCLR